MAGQIVLITGSTGHVGYRVLIEALNKGYQVRAAVRTEAKIAELKAARLSLPHLQKISFVIVPNIEKEGAFDEAVKGVDCIVHVASPLSKPDATDENEVIQPAVRGTLGILYSALKEPSVQRVVITSSVVAVNPAETRVFTADNVEPDPQGPYAHPMAAYAASKKLAYNRTRDLISQRKPHFTIINIMPTFVIGKNELATTTEAVASGSNRLPLIPILGHSLPAPMPGMVCHVDDVAYVHVASLDPTIKGNQNFGVNSDAKGIDWNEGIDIVKKHFPNEVEKGIFPLGGSLKASPMLFDASKTEQAFGIKFKNFEEQIVSLAGHYAELAAKA